MILLDACALVWWTLDPEKLSAKARRTCDSILKRGALVRAVSFGEIGIKIRKGKLGVGTSRR